MDTTNLEQMTVIQYRGFRLTPHATHHPERDVWEVFVEITHPDGTARRYKAPQVYRSRQSAEERCVHYGKSVIDKHPDRQDA